VSIDMAAYPGEVFTGRVMRIGDTVDPVTRAVEVQTELVNPQGRFRPEMYARIRHAHGTRRVPAVPVSAVVQSSGRAWVFLARAGGYWRVPVETGEPQGGMIPVLSGLQPDAAVVVDGAIVLNGQAGGGR
jgi:cobalt-zinc-cadmium efflux system membrane fusion protein